MALCAGIPPDELSVVEGSYTREKRLHISKATQDFKVRYTEGTYQNLSLSALLSERATTGSTATSTT
ncbi:MAG: hypothetical protein H6573_35890 [Lewinellaceae bacterium]|nr:hypothetical protein [Lewinellaceae bacterium]